MVERLGFCAASTRRADSGDPSPCEVCISPIWPVRAWVRRLLAALVSPICLLSIYLPDHTGSRLAAVFLRSVVALCHLSFLSSRVVSCVHPIKMWSYAVAGLLKAVARWSLLRRKPTGWMFVGMLAGEQKGPGHFWEKEWDGISAEKYQQYFLPLMHQFYHHQANAPRASCFMQDNAPAHAAGDTIAALESMQIPLLR